MSNGLLSLLFVKNKSLRDHPPRTPSPQDRNTASYSLSPANSPRPPRSFRPPNFQISPVPPERPAPPKSIVRKDKHLGNGPRKHVVFTTDADDVCEYKRGPRQPATPTPAPDPFNPPARNTRSQKPAPDPAPAPASAPANPPAKNTRSQTGLRSRSAAHVIYVAPKIEIAEDQEDSDFNYWHGHWKRVMHRG